MAGIADAAEKQEDPCRRIAHVKEKRVVGDEGLRWRAACWDHVDRASKRFTISQMIGRGGAHNEQNLRDEMAKCVLLCANCHQIKTYEDNDYRQIDRVIAKLNQPSLFDIDPA